jgi:hypothetical protein
MDWMIVWGFLLAVAFVLVLMRRDHIPKLTNWGAGGTICGMLVGGICWAEGTALGYRYALNFGSGVQALEGTVLIGEYSGGLP